MTSKKICNRLIQTTHVNTDLCVDLKTILLADRVAVEGKNYQGVLTRDGETHYTFREQSAVERRRNPRVFNGRRITVTIRENGSYYPNFKQISLESCPDITRLASEVVDELRLAHQFLVETVHSKQ